jgi:hypothetical protein
MRRPWALLAMAWDAIVLAAIECALAVVSRFRRWLRRHL